MCGRGCTYCGRERTIKARTKEINFDECISLCEKHNFKYINAKKEDGKVYIYFICNKHNEFGVQKMPKSNMNRNIKGCKYCKGDLPEWYVKNKIAKQRPFVKLIGEYKNMSTPIKCKCLIHNVIWNVQPNQLLKGAGCYKCGIKKQSASRLHSQDEYIAIIQKVNPNVEIISEYKGMKNDVTVKCKKCGYVWTLNAASLKNNGTRCKKCSYTYKGEDEIISILNNIGCYFIQQYKFSNCKDKRCLPFDFYIPKYNLCIEFDGEQHYKPKFGEANFKITQYHDNIKNDFCAKNKIYLLRIPYWDSSNAEKLIKEKINSIKTN